MRFAVRVFDGTYTTIYTTEAIDESTALKKIAQYHIALGGAFIKITATEIRV